MSGWRKLWETGLSGTVKSPKSGRQTVAEEKPFQRRCNLGTISMSLEVIWGMSAQLSMCLLAMSRLVHETSEPRAAGGVMSGPECQ